MSSEVLSPATGLSLKCMEIWGGNEATNSVIAAAGIDGWVVSQPYGGDESGGDMHFVSTCGAGEIARFMIADVSGHGKAASEMAVKLRRLMRKHINRLDQTRFARDLNREFASLAQEETFATALLASYYGPTEHLIICNAGHPPPLWYHAERGEWSFLRHTTSERAKTIANLPLGVIEPTDYHQFAVPVEVGDLVLIYTDALIEASDTDGRQLGGDGLLAQVQRLDPADPDAFCDSLLSEIAAYRGHASADDDATAVLLRPNGQRAPRQSIGEMIKVMGKMLGLVRV